MNPAEFELRWLWLAAVCTVFMPFTVIISALGGAYLLQFFLWLASRALDQPPSAVRFLEQPVAAVGWILGILFACVLVFQPASKPTEEELKRPRQHRGSTFFRVSQEQLGRYPRILVGLTAGVALCMLIPPFLGDTRFQEPVSSVTLLGGAIGAWLGYRARV